MAMQGSGFLQAVHAWWNQQELDDRSIDAQWFHMIISISGAFAKMTCPTCDQAVKRAVGKRSQAKDHGTKLEPLWTIVIGDWTSPFVRIFAFVSLGERLSGDCLGEVSEETASIIFCPMLFFHVSCLTTLEVLTASFHAMDEMLRSPNYERPLLALKQASWEVLWQKTFNPKTTWPK